MEWDTFILFQSLLDDFPRCMQEAEVLQSENLEDVHPIKLGIVGFSRYRPLEDWNYEQF